jgi:DNA mismatch repair ATPase MutS
MKIMNDVNNDFKYTYKLQHGISHIKGGVKVLKDLDYPKEIIERTTSIIRELIL